MRKLKDLIIYLLAAVVGGGFWYYLIVVWADYVATYPNY
jgi:hypothetical protein